MKKFYLFIALSFSGLLMAQPPLLVEQFDYTSGQALSDNGWFIHSEGGANPNPILVSDGGLSFSGYSASGVGNAALVTNNGQDINRPLSSNVNSGSVYASFLMTVTDNTPEGFFFHLGYYSNQTTPVFTAINSAFRARTYVSPGDDPATQFKLGLAFNATTPEALTGNYNIGETYLVVVKYTFIEGELNDTVSLFVFASGDNLTTEPETPILGPFTGTAADAPVLQAVILRQYNNNQRITVDGIVVRTSWDLISPLSTNNFNIAENIAVYPNPVDNGFVNITTNLFGDKEITLVDLNGRILKQEVMTSDYLDLSHVSKGIYVLQTRVGNLVFNNKLIVK